MLMPKDSPPCTDRELLHQSSSTFVEDNNGLHLIDTFVPKQHSNEPLHLNGTIFHSQIFKTSSLDDDHQPVANRSKRENKEFQTFQSNLPSWFSSNLENIDVDLESSYNTLEQLIFHASSDYCDPDEINSVGTLMDGLLNKLQELTNKVSHPPPVYPQLLQVLSAGQNKHKSQQSDIMEKLESMELEIDLFMKMAASIAARCRLIRALKQKERTRNDMEQLKTRLLLKLERKTSSRNYRILQFQQQFFEFRQRLQLLTSLFLSVVLLVVLLCMLSTIM